MGRARESERASERFSRAQGAPKFSRAVCFPLPRTRCRRVEEDPWLVPGVGVQAKVAPGPRNRARSEANALFATCTTREARQRKRPLYSPRTNALKHGRQGCVACQDGGDVARVRLGVVGHFERVGGRARAGKRNGRVRCESAEKRNGTSRFFTPLTPRRVGPRPLPPPTPPRAVLFISPPPQCRPTPPHLALLSSLQTPPTTLLPPSPPPSPLPPP